jgi:maleate isomerase
MTGDRWRLALLVPSSNTVMENDLHDRLDKQRFTVHTARMYLEETTATAERIMIEQAAPAAAELVATVRPDLLVFGCTSAGSLGGLPYDREVCERLGGLAGCPAIGVLSSVHEALERRGLRRIAVVTPYNAELTASVSDSLTAQGLEVVVSGGLGIEVNVELATPTPDAIADFVTDTMGSASVDGVFISCTNFRALEALPELTKKLQKPVITSNSAVLEAIERALA